MYRLGRRPGLDGVRALAIAVVFLSHVQWHVPGGYYGVDVFFVLSGFLITTLLLSEHGRTGGISLVRFYVRRTRRLLPALLCALVLVAVLFSVLSFQGQLWPSELAVLLYVGNWFQATGHRLAGGLLVQTWSLGIEEQFYLLWPLVLLAGVSRRWSTRTLLLIALVPAVGSFTLRMLLWEPGGPGAAANAFPYFSSFTRADSVLLGCALAIAIADEQLRLRLRVLQRPVLAGAALAVIVGAAVTDPAGHPAVWAAVVVASAVLVGHIALVDSSPLTRVLGTKPLVWLGARSYGVYLYHYPIIVGVLASSQWMTDASLLIQTIFFTCITLVVAGLSYRFVELPLQRAELKPITVRLPRRVRMRLAKADS